MVHLYYCDISEVLSEAEKTGDVPVRMMKCLDKERTEAVNNFKFMPGKIACAAAGMLLYEALSFEKGQAPDISKLEFRKGEFGKPYIQNLPDFHYSISHSGTYVVLATADKPIGVDVQEMEMRSDPDNIADRFFSKEENEYLKKIADTDERNREFFRLWSAKEAFIKMTGTGLRRELATFTVNLEGMTVTESHSEGVSGYILEPLTLIRSILVICFGEKLEKLYTKKIKI